ncbi:MAG: energy transducer TonB [Acidobacteriota bacterium]|nr:energy transducer TonB [Acidobacteriota bacterium]
MLPNEVLSAVEGPANPVNETVWQHPSRSVKICVPERLGFLLAERALRTFRAKDPSEIGGLLFGRTTLNGSELHIFITEAEFIPSEGSLYNSTPNDQAALAAALARHKKRLDSVPVGYFRSDIRDGFSLTEQDKRFIERYLPNPTSMSLLIRPFQMGVCMAGIFLWEKDRVEGEFTDFEVPLFASETGSIEENKAVQADPLPLEPVMPAAAPTPLVTPVPAAVTNLAVPVPRASEQPEKSGREFPYFITAIAVCLCGLLLGSTLYFYERLQTSRSQPVVQARVQPPITSSSTPGSTSSNTSKSELGLRVSRPAAGQLDVVWDRNLPVNARVGLLEIVDGSTRQKLILDQTQLRVGKLTYFSNSTDISFRLDVAVQNKPSITEYVRVLGFKTQTTRPAESVAGAEQSRSIAGRKPTPVAAKASLPVPAINPPEQQTESSGVLPLPAPISLPLVSSENQVPLVLPQVSARNTEPAPQPRSSDGIAHPEDKSSGVKTGTTFAGTDTSQAQPAKQVMPDIRQIMPAGVPYIIRVGIVMTVNKKGQVTEAHSTTGPSILTNACIAAAQKWRFTPASVNHQSVESSYSIVFVFRPKIR